jgi:hypothetical protein
MALDVMLGWRDLQAVGKIWRFLSNFLAKNLMINSHHKHINIRMLLILFIISQWVYQMIVQAHLGFGDHFGFGCHARLDGLVWTNVWDKCLGQMMSRICLQLLLVLKTYPDEQPTHIRLPLIQSIIISFIHRIAISCLDEAYLSIVGLASMLC